MFLEGKKQQELLMHWACGTRERMISRIARGASTIGLSLTEIEKPLREAGFMGAGPEFRFGHSKFETLLRQAQEYAEMAARKTASEVYEI